MKNHRVISFILIIAVVFSSITNISSTKAIAADNVIHVVRNDYGQYIGTKD